MLFLSPISYSIFHFIYSIFLIAIIIFFYPIFLIHFYAINEYLLLHLNALFTISFHFLKSIIYLLLIKKTLFYFSLLLLAHL